MYRGAAKEVQYVKRIKPKVVLVYEGRLGSSRADSTYVIENARLFSRFADVEILVSKRSGWSIPSYLLKQFSITELGKPFNPKTLTQSIMGQLAFGICIRKFLKERSNSNLFLIFHDWWPLHSLHGIKRTNNNFNLILEVHNQIPLGKLESLFFRHIDLFIATNAIKYLELNEIYSEKVVLERNCVRLDRYEKPGIKPGKAAQKLRAFKKNFPFIVGYTGSFGPEKNPQLLSRLPYSLPDIGFVFVGNMGLRQQKELKSLPNVLILGPQPSEDIPFIQTSCDALLISLDVNNKTSRFYTSTMKLMEYAAARRPIIAPAVESISELLSENEYYPYRADSVYECISALESAVTDSISRKGTKLPDSSRLASFSWEKRNKRVMDKLLSMNTTG
jgi:glycosyltransferase involved in cell wall biosynthesis